jgi:LacI family repressor for deo operon, udp, cdd, tsx, nupC, and nupG
MPTLQDVARLAGCSTATVSKVLSNTPYVAEETRARVLEAVQRLNYRPNLAGRALSRGRTHIVGVVFPHVYDPIFRDPLVLAIVEGIETVLTREGYNILLSTPRIASEAADPMFEQLLRSGYLDGMIAIDSVPGSPVAALAQTYHIPLVVLGYHDTPYQVHCDDYAGGQLMMNYLLGLGHRRIGVIRIPEAKNIAVDERWRGLCDAWTAAGRDIAELATAEGDYSTQSGAAAAAALLERHLYLTAIASLNDRMAIGALQTLHALGRSVPNEISVIGYDNLALSEMTSPPLTTVSQHATLLGERSAQMLLQVLRHEQPSIAVIAPTLRERASCAPLRAVDSAEQSAE